MKAAVFSSTHTAPQSFLHVGDVPRPQLEAGHVLLRVVACGVCRTDLHIVEGDLPPLRPRLIPGHQIVGEVIEGATQELPLGSRVGVSWMGGVDGDCWYCHHGMENLCDKPVFTGYTVDGGYAEYALVRADFSVESGCCDVELSYNGRIGIGKAGSGQLFGGAEATVAALRELGFSIPFYLVTVISVATVRGWPVIVTFRPFSEGTDLFGIAQSENDVTSSSMATLDALNRFLSRAQERP